MALPKQALHVFAFLTYNIAYGGHLPVSEHVWEKESVLLPCGVTSESQDVKITWCKETVKCDTVVQKFPNKAPEIRPPWSSSDVELVAGYSINITSALHSRDNGTFRCTAAKTEQFVDLTVLVLPNITLTGPRLPVPENKDLVFTCEAEGGYPLPNITWENTSNSNYSETANDTSISMHMTATREMHTKDIQCIAAQGERSTSSRLTLNVTYKPRVKISTIPARTTHTLDGSVTLVCAADGNPEPEVTWSLSLPLSGRPLEGFDGNSTLGRKIVKIRIANPGTYACTANNKEGNTSAVITLSKYKQDTFSFTLLAILSGGAVMLLAALVALAYRLLLSRKRSPHPVEGDNLDEGGCVTVPDRDIHVRSLNTIPEGHYAAIWFENQTLGDSEIRRQVEPTVYAQIDLNASAKPRTFKKK